jgi:8-oxo-dGTP diphosphatase
MDEEVEPVTLTADVVLFGRYRWRLYVLLIKRGWPPFEGCWALPGGYVDPGEQAPAAARRELAEEGGLHAGSLTLVGVYDAPGRDPRGRFVSCAYTTRARHALGRALPQPLVGDDAAAARWVRVDHALSAPLAFDHAAILRERHAPGWSSRAARAAGNTPQAV